MRAGVFWSMVSALGLAMAGTAQAQTYRWVEASAPPPDVVRAPGGFAMPVCQFRGRGRQLLGGFHDGRCHADLGGEKLSDTRYQFLVVVSGPAGGKWGVMSFRAGFYRLPDDYVFGPALNTDVYGAHTAVCASAGVPGLTPYDGGPGGENGRVAGACAREPIGRADDTWALIGRLQ